jgi:hypothetical protein
VYPTYTHPSGSPPTQPSPHPTIRSGHDASLRPEGRPCDPLPRRPARRTRGSRVPEGPSAARLALDALTWPSCHIGWAVARVAGFLNRPLPLPRFSTGGTPPTRRRRPRCVTHIGPAVGRCNHPALPGRFEQLSHSPSDGSFTWGALHRGQRWRLHYPVGSGSSGPRDAPRRPRLVGCPTRMPHP